MSYIQFSKVTFSYPSGLAPVFEDLSLVLDTDWKLGIIGRNGMGKSTLFGLLTRELQGEGSILADFGFLKFPSDSLFGLKRRLCYRHMFPINPLHHKRQAGGR